MIATNFQYVSKGAASTDRSQNQSLGPEKKCVVNFFQSAYWTDFEVHPLLQCVPLSLEPASMHSVLSMHAASVQAESADGVNKIYRYTRNIHTASHIAHDHTHPRAYT